MIRVANESHFIGELCWLTKWNEFMEWKLFFSRVV